jgi:hypothetical protein
MGENVKKEFVLWGTRDGVEDVIRVNGVEVQKSLEKAESVKRLLEKRGGFDSIRIQEIDLENWDIKSAFVGGLK